MPPKKLMRLILARMPLVANPLFCDSPCKMNVLIPLKSGLLMGR
jgi:hypothetical protein